MKKIMLISLLSFSIIPAFAMDVEDDTPVPEPSCMAKFIEKAKKAGGAIKNNKLNTFVVSGLVITTLTGGACDWANVGIGGTQNGLTLTALPSANNTLPHQAGNCYYVKRHDCDIRAWDATIANHDDCEAFIERDGEFYLQSCFNDFKSKEIQGFGMGSFSSRALMLIFGYYGGLLGLFRHQQQYERLT